MEKTIINEYFQINRLKIWERMFESGKLDFTIVDMGKNIQKEIKWFTKNKFVSIKGHGVYRTNLKNKLVKSVMSCFLESLIHEGKNIK